MGYLSIELEFCLYPQNDDVPVLNVHGDAAAESWICENYISRSITVYYLPLLYVTTV
eukprot:gene2734-13533_t